MMNINTKQQILLTINGINKACLVRNADTLLYTLREQFGLMGAKPGCENGDCGACTVIIAGKPINSCHILSVEAVTSPITTIEGLQDHTVQNAFIKNGAIQCGYCTPGFIMNCHALVDTHPQADDVLMDEWLDSNICRCTGYQEIKETIRSLVQKDDSRA